jgi:asparagine synthase (glutamine-hydrolysing)
VSSFSPIVGENSAVLCSGGLDSSLAAMIAARVLGKTLLVACGAEGSRDSSWAPEAADLLGLPLSLTEMSPDVAWEALPELIYSTERSSRMDVEIALPFLLASKTARKMGFDLVISGQGPDELFAGYARYADVYRQGGSESLEQVLWRDLSTTHRTNLERDQQAILFAGCDPFFPYLERAFVNVALSIPGHLKMRNGAGERKWILRELGVSMGLPTAIASRPKKATQYSSGSRRVLVDACRDNLLGSTRMSKKETERIIQPILDRIALELGHPASGHTADIAPRFNMEPTYRLLEFLEDSSRQQ